MEHDGRALIGRPVSNAQHQCREPCVAAQLHRRLSAVIRQTGFSVQKMAASVTRWQTVKPEYDLRANIIIVIVRAGSDCILDNSI